MSLDAFLEPDAKQEVEPLDAALQIKLDEVVARLQ
jgi:hypothetical protein